MRPNPSLPFAFVGLVLLAADAPTKLEVLPAKVQLRGPSAAQRLVVLRTFADGSSRELSSTAAIEPDKATVAVDGRGRLVPVADGKAEVGVRAGGVEAKAPV